MIDNLPTSKTQGVFIGLVEVKGTVECEQPLESYLAQAPCVYYSFNIEERWSRLVTETESDGKGGTRTVTRRETGWTSVASETEMTPFYVQDDTGHLLVRPEGARIEAAGVFSESCTPMNALYYGKGPAGGIIDSDLVRRFTESIIPLQAPLFVIGQARERKDVVAPEIATDPQASEFLISTRSQEQVSSGLGWQIWLFFFLGAITAPGGHIAGFFAGRERSKMFPRRRFSSLSSANLASSCWSGPSVGSSPFTTASWNCASGSSRAGARSTSSSSAATT